MKTITNYVRARVNVFAFLFLTAVVLGSAYAFGSEALIAGYLFGACAAVLGIQEG